MRKDKNNKDKYKKAILTSIFFLCFFIGIGTFIIYRASIPENKLTPLSGTLKSIELKENLNPLNKREVKNYSILLNLDGIPDVYGIYGGTREQALKKKKLLNLNLHKKYTLLIDGSVVNGFDQTNLGIRVIKSGEKIIFKENRKSDVYFGIIFIAMGVVSSLLFYGFARRKFG